MARYYLMDVQTTLFGEWSLVREWGRIDRAGQVRIVVFPTEAAALKAMETIEIAKVGRRAGFPRDPIVGPEESSRDVRVRLRARGEKAHGGVR